MQRGSASLCSIQESGSTARSRGLHDPNVLGPHEWTELGPMPHCLVAEWLLDSPSPSVYSSDASSVSESSWPVSYGCEKQVQE